MAIAYSTSNVSTLSSGKKYTLKPHTCRLHDVPVVIINRQCIELKGLSQIVCGAIWRSRVKMDIFVICVQSLTGPI